MDWCVRNHRRGRLSTPGRGWVGLVSVKGMTGRKDLEQEELRKRPWKAIVLWVDQKGDPWVFSTREAEAGWW